MTVRVNFDFKKRLAEIIEGNLLQYCYQCGACVGDCPSARFDPSFNPRQIMLAALYGLEDRLLGSDSPIWKCSNCYNCYERCPQHMKPVEVIIALKNLLAQEGHAPEGMDAIVERVKETGRPVQVTPAVQRIRNELGLEPLPELDASELKEILRP